MSIRKTGLHLSLSAKSSFYLPAFEISRSCRTASEPVVINSFSQTEYGLNRLMPKEIRSRQAGLNEKICICKFFHSLLLVLIKIKCRIIPAPPPARMTPCELTWKIQVIVVFLVFFAAKLTAITVPDQDFLFPVPAWFSTVFLETGLLGEYCNWQVSYNSIYLAVFYAIKGVSHGICWAIWHVD